MNRKESLRKIINTPLKFDFSILILPIILMFWVGIIDGLFFAFCIFSCTLMHEYAHAYVCNRKDILVNHIKFEIFGAKISIGEISNYKDEIKILLAGPNFNILFGLFLLLITTLTKNSSLLIFSVASLTIGILNILPVIIFDGGRALHLFVSNKFTESTAFKVDLIVNMVFSTLLIVASLFILDSFLLFVVFLLGGVVSIIHLYKLYNK